MGFENLEKKIIEKLREIYDPEIPVNIYDLGLIYSIDCEENGIAKKCVITMTLTSATCPVSDTLLNKIYDISYMIDEEDDLEVVPNLVFEPQWSQDMISDDAKLALGML